ncbi:YIF1-domain-containing protein [Alternaria rosae]|uniref:YIF1-domain-containing protein n=1 Tax=Alternaria rosae TaxID=1187941 RepID=UPI001E8D997A|nr:YIF1-domain-containing protein [Alternaria rosae]KAH6870621.1 YIF1-domain-containing protein [Alternaria rosae]
MQRPNYGNPPPAHSPPLHHPVPQHVSTVPQLRSPPPPQPPSQPQSGYGYGSQAGGMPPQQGGYGVHPSFGGFINDPTAQLGFQMGKSAVDAGQHYMEQNLGRLVSVSALKHYFNVTNSYVLNKLRIILFPWWHRPWSRQRQHTADPSASAALLYQPPREDVNSPDMYIPTMALVTYILLSTLFAGLRGAFNPELLGKTATVAIAVTLLEILIIRTGTFLLAISSSSQLLDLVAYSGYKFVHVIVSLLITNLANWIGFSSSWVGWVIFLYCFSANSFFLLRSLKYVLLPDNKPQDAFGAPAPVGYQDIKTGQKSRRTQFLFVYSYVVQFGFMIWLSKV